MTEPSTPPDDERAVGEDSLAGDADAPTTIWAAIRVDLIPLALALAALAVNGVSPDALSPALTPLLLIAIGWVAYRIVGKVRDVRGRR